MFIALGWYDVIVLPANECKWTFKEGDVAILSAPRPGSGLIIELILACLGFQYICICFQFK